MYLEWLLVLFALLLPLVLNVRCWRKDLERLGALTAARKKLSVEDLIRGGAPRVSFLIAAWNEEATLARCIDAILKLRYPDLELVLCAGGSDRTWEIASQFAGPRVVAIEQQPGDGKQKSLTRAIGRATGEIIYLLDADCLLSEAGFARTLDPILNQGETAVTSVPCTPFPEQVANPFAMSQAATWVYTSIHQARYSRSLVGMNAAIRREALEKAGGFDGTVRAGGDFDLGKRLLRAGFRIRYEPDATFPIEFQTGLRVYLRQQARWLRNVVIHGLRFASYREAASCLLTSMVGLAMLAAPLIVGLGWLLGAPRMVVVAGAALWLVGFFHALFSRLRYLKVAALWLTIPAPPGTVLKLPWFLAIDFLAWTIPLLQYPSRSAREQW